MLGNIVPSSVFDLTPIGTQIERAGTYSLLAYKPESMIPPITKLTAKGSSNGKTPAMSTHTARHESRIASIAHVSVPPEGEAQGSPDDETAGETTTRTSL